MTDILPTYHAVLTFPPGVNRTDLAVFDETVYLVATTSWKPAPTDNPATWDQQLVDLGWRRTSPWQSTGAGLEAAVEWTGDHQ